MGADIESIAGDAHGQCVGAPIGIHQGAQKLTRRLRAPRPLGGQTTFNDREKIGGNGVHVVGRRLGAAILQRRSAAERVPAAAENVVAQASETEHVVEPVGTLARQDLWTGILGRDATRRRRHGEISALTGRGSKIDELRRPMFRHHDVRRLEVAVNDTD